MLFVAIYAYLTMPGKFLQSIYNYHLCILIIKSSNVFPNRAREALRQCLPDQLRDTTFNACLQEDRSTKHWLNLLIKNLESNSNDQRQISPLTS